MSLRRIVRFLKWKRFSWIGHSMGAGLGAFYASVFPSDVSIDFGICKKSYFMIKTIKLNYIYLCAIIRWTNWSCWTW